MTSVAGQKRKRDEKEHEDAASVPESVPATIADTVEAKARIPLKIGGPVPYDIPELDAIKGMSLEYAETDASNVRLAKTVIRQYAWRVAVNAVKRRELADVLQHVGPILDMIASYDVTVLLFIGEGHDLIVYDPVRNSRWSMSESELDDDVDVDNHDNRSPFAHPWINVIAGVSRLLVPPSSVVGEYRPVLGSCIADASALKRYGLAENEKKLFDFSAEIVTKHESAYKDPVLSLRDAEGKTWRVSVYVRKVGGMITPQFTVIGNDDDETTVPVAVDRPGDSVLSRMFVGEHGVKIGWRVVHGRLIVCIALSEKPALCCVTLDVQFDPKSWSLKCRPVAEFWAEFQAMCVLNVTREADDETEFDRKRTQEGMFTFAEFCPFLDGLLCWCHSGVFYCDAQRAPRCVVRATRDGTVHAIETADGASRAVYNRTIVDRFEALVSSGYSNAFYAQTSTLTLSFACNRDGFVVESAAICESDSKPDLALRVL